ncbi:PRD domain-containing protein [Enterococcus faecium]
MIVIKKINNNALLVRSKTGNESIVMGGGVGFNSSVGKEVDQSKIEKLFSLEDPKMQKFKEVISNTESKYFDLTERIILRAEEELNVNIGTDSHLLFSLADHLKFAVNRSRNGSSMPNLMLQEIRMLYPKEFSIGNYGLSLINRNFSVSLPIDEAGYIAMHLVNAFVSDMDVSVMNIIVFVKLVSDIVNEIYMIDENSFAYQRFLTHLKFLSRRLFSSKEVESVGLNDMYPTLINKDSNLEYCINKIDQAIYENFDYHFSQEEKVYLMIHILKIIQ